MDIDYNNYDSSNFATLTESMNHSKSNPLLINNLSDGMIMDFDGVPYYIQEPSCTFKDNLLYIFGNDVEEIEIPVDHFYRPELTALEIYNNADFWYIILLLNNMFSVTQYNRHRIKIIPNHKLDAIARFVYMAKHEIRFIEENDISQMAFI